MTARSLMLGKKIQLDEASTQLLKTLKFRTGLTHQYLCRMAFCVSLDEAGEVDPAAYDEQGLEFNRYTLTGEWDTIFVAFLHEWMASNDPDGTYDETAWARAHINRGLAILPRRVRLLSDVAALVPVPG
jgi:DNA sulfur modification protein DndE